MWIGFGLHEINREANRRRTWELSCVQRYPAKEEGVIGHSEVVERRASNSRVAFRWLLGVLLTR